MAPHWTQFDGATSTSARPSSPTGADRVDLRGAEVRPQLGDVGRDAGCERAGGWAGRPASCCRTANTDDSRSKVSVPSWTTCGAASSTGRSGCSSSGSVLTDPMLTRPLVIVLSDAQRAADEEAAAEQLPQVAHLVELLPDEAGAHRVVVRRERGGGHRRVVRRFGNGGERGLGGEPPGLDRVVHALQRRDVHHARPRRHTAGGRARGAAAAAHGIPRRGWSSLPTRSARRPRGWRGSSGASSGPGAGRAG